MRVKRLFLHFLFLLETSMYFSSLIRIIFGKLSLKTRLCRSSAGGGRLPSIVVIRRHSIARCSSPSILLTFAKVLLTILTWLSTKPLLCGKCEDEVIWEKPYSSANQRKAELLYWGPLSERMICGTYCSLNICFK